MILTFKQWLNERVVKYDAGRFDEPVLVLTNPTKAELKRLGAFAKEHDLTISNWVDMHPPTEWRTIYSLLDKKWYVWAGFKMHADIMHDYNIPDAGTVLGRIYVRGGKLEVEFGDIDNRQKDTAKANSAVRKFMKDNSIAGKVRPGRA